MDSFWLPPSGDVLGGGHFLVTAIIKVWLLGRTPTPLFCHHLFVFPRKACQSYRKIFRISRGIDGTSTSAPTSLDS